MSANKSVLNFKQGDLIMGGLLLGFAVALYVLTYHFSGYEIEKQPSDVGPAFWPRLLLAALAVEAVALMAIAAAKKRRVGPPAGQMNAVFQLRPLVMLAAFLLYIWFTTFFGFIIATLAFMLLAFFLLGVRKVPILILVPPAITYATYLLFGQVLNIYLPAGSLF